MKAGNFLKGILIGIGVGILIAPTKGSETRRKISKSVNDLSDYIHDSIDDGIDTMHDEATNFADDASENIDKARSKMSEAFH